MRYNIYDVKFLYFYVNIRFVVSFLLFYTYYFMWCHVTKQGFCPCYFFAQMFEVYQKNVNCFIQCAEYTTENVFAIDFLMQIWYNYT